MANLPKASTHAREGDLPRTELVKKAEEALRIYEGRAQIYFKFTCAWCAERCALAEPNKLFERGECSKCGRETIIDVGGFMLTYRTKSP